MKVMDFIKKVGVWLMLLIIVIVFAIAIPNFASPENFVTILRQISNMGMLAAGMTIVLITQGIDLSVAAVMPLTGVVSALLIVAHWPVWIAWVLGVLVGGVVGIVNGVFVTYTGIPAMIMTLGMSYIARGTAFILTKGYPVYNMPPMVKVLGQGYIFGVIPVCVLILVLVLVFTGVLLSKTQLGRQYYALGGNEEAARLSGINTKSVKVSAYILAGLLSGLSGIVMMSRLNSGQPLSGEGMEMDALIACVVGGVSFMGGEGNVGGLIAGVLVMGVLANGLAVAGMNSYMQEVVKGIVLVIVVSWDSYTSMKKD